MRTRIFLALLCLFAFVVVGCGDDKESGTTSSSSSSSSTSSSSSSSAPAGADPAIAKMVPEKYKSKGTLNVASDASYAPVESVDSDGKTVVGIDPDLAHALGKVMGLKLDVKNAPFDGIIPGLAAGKYDLGMSAFTDTKEREQTVDFVTYFTAGTAFLSNASDKTEYTGLDSLCNKTVAVEKGTTQQADAQKQGKSCKVTLSVFPDQNGANLAIASGRADVGMLDSPVAAYQAEKSGGKLKASTATYADAPYGIAIPKDSGLAEPILAALKKLMADGTYAEILKKYNVANGAITDPKINGAVS